MAIISCVRHLKWKASYPQRMDIELDSFYCNCHASTERVRVVFGVRMPVALCVSGGGGRRAACGIGKVHSLLREMRTAAVS
ncbi:hypothetical protein BaRGS_00001240 [Batillaria attramentaria]|uniref:Uncharacterized protein n=1 Tax=Batillaria attramentaria TaxID=370345 RepID=A0ABD0M5T3_9CAEN